LIVERSFDIYYSGQANRFQYGKNGKRSSPARVTRE